MATIAAANFSGASSPICMYKIEFPEHPVW